MATLDETVKYVSSAAPVFGYSDARLEHAMSHGVVNTTPEQLLANIKSAIRRGHPQVTPGPIRNERICLVGSGPSLNDTEGELVQLSHEGALIVTMNGAYHWCLERNIRPSAQIVLDGRASNARFVTPVVPRCRYVLASQCAPEVWDAVEGRDNVWIFHAHVGREDETGKALSAFYGPEHWFGIGGGVTVATRAMVLYRLMGYPRFDLFGIDCCWMDGIHHAMAQPENEKDKRIEIDVADANGEHAKRFVCSPWHLKQAEDFSKMFREMADSWMLNIHGDGMLKHMLTVHAG